MGEPVDPCAAQRGQVVVIVAGAMLALLLMVALLLDGAAALVARRTMQDAVDAAAMAGANAITSLGCSNDGIVTPAVSTAVIASLALNGYPDALTATDAEGRPRPHAVISCPQDAKWYDSAVRVELVSPGTRLVVAPIGVSVDATAMNGGLFEVALSVLTLSPTDCGSFAYNGTAEMRFEGSVHINSSATRVGCGGTATSGAATGSGAGSIVMDSGQPLEVVGEVNAGIKVTPGTLTGVEPIGDPFLTLEEPHLAKDPDGRPLLVKSAPQPLPTWATSAKLLTLTPGWYTGTPRGSTPTTLTVKNGQILVLLKADDPAKPAGNSALGTFVFENINIQNNGTICSLPAKNGTAAWDFISVKAICEATTNAKDTWLAACPTGTTGTGSCGVLIEFLSSNSPALSCSGPSPLFSTVAGGRAFINPYFAPANTWDLVTRYNGFLVWTARGIDVGRGCEITLQGGGTNDIVGTVYAPTVSTSLAGNPAGVGGTAEATMQVIGWDVHLSGNATLTFRYHAGSLARFTGYGLVD